MEDIDIVLNNSNTSNLHVDLVSTCPSIPSSKSENAAATDDGHLPHGGEHRVPPQYTESATVELPLSKHIVQHHQKPQVVQIRRGVHPLRSSHNFGAYIRAKSQNVVDNLHKAESGGRGVGDGGFGHSEGGWVAAPDNVVEVEVEVAELLCFHAHFFHGHFSREFLRHNRGDHEI
ncbi:hypothetical protein ABFS82_06G133500 [Erythranthe guttata]